MEIDPSTSSFNIELAGMYSEWLPATQEYSTPEPDTIVISGEYERFGELARFIFESGATTPGTMVGDFGNTSTITTYVGDYNPNSDLLYFANLDGLPIKYQATQGTTTHDVTLYYERFPSTEFLGSIEGWWTFHSLALQLDPDGRAVFTGSYRKGNGPEQSTRIETRYVAGGDIILFYHSGNQQVFGQALGEGIDSHGFIALYGFDLEGIQRMCSCGPYSFLPADSTR